MTTAATTATTNAITAVTTGAKSPATIVTTATIATQSSSAHGASGAAPLGAAAQRKERLGLLLGLVGVVSFSLTLPMTRLAVAELSPWLVAFGRMALAGAIATAWLVATRAPRPRAADLGLLLATSIGVVIGFPLLSTLAMRTVPAHHGAVIIGAIPFATALLATLWFGERHTRRFWLCALAGSLLVIVFALRGDGAPAATAGAVDANVSSTWAAWTLGSGDLALFGAVLAAALGYASGGRLAVRIGGANTILWALVLALPATLPATIALAWNAPLAASAGAWIGFAYITLISQLTGFFAWYNGLALGGIGRVGQLQLLQVFFTIGAASLIFSEHVRPDAWIFALAVVALLAFGRGFHRSKSK